MKGFGMVVLVVGIIAALVGIGVFIAMASEGISGDEVDMAVSLGRGLGIYSYMDSSEQLLFNLARFRMILLIGGALAAILGAVLVRFSAQRQ